MTKDRELSLADEPGLPQPSSILDLICVLVQSQLTLTKGGAYRRPVPHKYCRLYCDPSIQIDFIATAALAVAATSSSLQFVSVSVLIKLILNLEDCVEISHFTATHLKPTRVCEELTVLKCYI